MIDVIARALGGTVAGHNSVLVPGPGHSRDDRSLSIKFDTNAPDGFWCHSFAGDDWRACRDHVRGALGLRNWKSWRSSLDARLADARRRASSPDDPASRTKRALSIWNATRSGSGTIAARYLASRGIVLEQWPASLRFHPSCPRPKDDDGSFVSPLPAMVGLVEHAERGPVAVHCTYLRADGSGKANIEKPKAMFGPVAGGAVRFGLPHAGEWLAVCEGIETALSVAVACSMPTWAALSASGIKNLVLPAKVARVIICADHDANGTGEQSARYAAARWVAEGRRVRFAMPPEPDTDLNDVLTGRRAAKINGAHHVA